MDGTAPHVIEPKAPGAVDEYINLGEAWDARALAIHKNTILRLTNQISQSFNKAYDTFKEALDIHDDWEKIYINNMDFKKGRSINQQIN